MNSLFNPADVSGILLRINKLTPESQRQWGKMNAAQMLAHCNAALETAAGITNPKRIFIGRILSPLLKPKFVSDHIFDKNYPTDKTYIFTSRNVDFETERSKVMALIGRFAEGGPSKCTTHPHSFFGKLTPQEWAATQWKHLDHHLRQFGV